MSVSTPTGSMPRALRDGVNFLGDERTYWRLMLHGAVFVMLTLGIYRFWLVTDMRRFLWSNTEISGDSLEYTGTAFEILVGFLAAVALLVPLYGAFFIAALDLGPLGRASGGMAFLLLVFLGHFAVYRARRYRLTRTLYRGIRFRQTGSASRYAICAMFCWAILIATLGLAYPWAVTRLERLKMDNTFYGDLAGEFRGSAGPLFWRGLPLWLAVVGPLVAGFAVAIRGINWNAVMTVVAQGGDDMLGRLEGASPGFAAAIVIAILGGIWAVLAAAALYPAFQAMVLRWWLAGLRFGTLTVSSRVRTGHIYRVYMRFLWYSALFSVTAGGIAVGVAFLYGATISNSKSTIAEIVVTVALLCSYVVAALAYSTIYQVTVKLGLWCVAAESVEFAGVAVLARVKAVGHPSSSLGEGLANALRVGGW